VLVSLGGIAEALGLVRGGLFVTREVGGLASVVISSRKLIREDFLCRRSRCQGLNWSLICFAQAVHIVVQFLALAIEVWCKVLVLV
jgi:hypothetical protein